MDLQNKSLCCLGKGLFLFTHLQIICSLNHGVYKMSENSEKCSLQFPLQHDILKCLVLLFHLQSSVDWPINYSLIIGALSLEAETKQIIQFHFKCDFHFRVVNIGKYIFKFKLSMNPLCCPVIEDSSSNSNNGE